MKRRELVGLICGTVDLQPAMVAQTRDKMLQKGIL